MKTILPIVLAFVAFLMLGCNDSDDPPEPDYPKALHAEKQRTSELTEDVSFWMGTTLLAALGGAVLLVAGCVLGTQARRDS